MKTPPLLVILGETASGKSTLAMDVAAKLNGEIISADSWTTRRKLDIGSAKPSKEDRARIKHYLIDIAEPDEDFTAADFKPLANKAIRDISDRGKLPIMVGGSGLYIDSALYDFSFLDPGDRKAREKMNSMSIEDLVRLIKEMNLEIPKGLDTRNKRRLIRFIESKGAMPTKGKLRENTLIIGLEHDPSQRRTIIEKRVDQMIEAGLQDEVKQLSDKYGWECDSLMGVGYRQWRSYFEGSQTLEETRNQIVSASLNLAKKQRTWFKRNKSIHWFKTPVNSSEIVEFVTTNMSRLHLNR